MADFRKLLTNFAIESLYRNAATSDQRFAAMSFDQFRTDFVDVLSQQARIRINQVREIGSDEGKLTLEERSLDGTWTRIMGIAPADCYNLIPAGKTVEDFAALFGQYAMLVLPKAQAETVCY